MSQVERKYGYAEKVDVIGENMNPSQIDRFNGGLYHILFADKEYSPLTKYKKLLKHGTIMKIEETTTAYGKKVLKILEDVRGEYQNRFALRSQKQREERKGPSIQKLLQLLPKKNIHTGLDLALYPVNEIKSTFTNGILSPILGKPIDHAKGRDMIEVSEIVGFDIRKDIEEYLSVQPVPQAEVKKLGYEGSLRETTLDDLEKILREIKKFKRSEQEYLRIEDKRKQEKGQAKIDLLAELKEKGIKNALDLLLFGTEHFEDMFGKVKIGIILGRTLDSQVLRKDLVDLSVELGWDLYQDVKDLLIKKANIHNMEDLLKYGVTKFKDTFGIRIVGIINEEYSRANKKDLVKMGNRLRGQKEKGI